MKRFRLSGLNSWSIVNSLLALLLLSSCADIPSRDEAIDMLEQAPVCCQSLSAIQFAPFPADTSDFVRIDSSLPVFEFDSGRSHFVAYELPDVAMPYRIVMESYAVGYSLPNATLLKPTMAILADDYRVLYTTGPDTFTFTKLGLGESLKRFELSFSNILNNAFYEGAIAIDDPHAKYLLIYTTAAELAAAVPFQYMGVTQVYTGNGYWFPLPTGTRQSMIEHSAHGAFRLNIGAMRIADPGELKSFGSPADEASYSGNGFSVRPPAAEGYRFADKSIERYSHGTNGVRVD